MRVPLAIPIIISCHAVVPAAVLFACMCFAMVRKDGGGGCCVCDGLPEIVQLCLCVVSIVIVCVCRFAWNVVHAGEQVN